MPQGLLNLRLTTGGRAFKAEIDFVRLLASSALPARICTPVGTILQS
jgi:hypothetical protein